MKLSGYNRNWMTGAQGEKPVLCRLVWVPHKSEHGSRHDLMRSWAARNRLFTVDRNGYYQQVHFEYGVGFYTQPEMKPFAYKTRLSLATVMQSAYLFTNGIH